MVCPLCIVLVSSTYVSPVERCLHQSCLKVMNHSTFETSHGNKMMSMQL